MKFEVLNKFEKDLRKLHPNMQKHVVEKLPLFDEYPARNSLRLRKLEGKRKEGIWEGHITMAICFTFEWSHDQETRERMVILRRVGGHDIYDNP